MRGPQNALRFGGPDSPLRQHSLASGGFKPAQCLPNAASSIRQCQPIDQDHGVRVDAACILVGSAGLVAVLCDEIVIVADEEKKIAWSERVEYRGKRHALPFLRQVV